MPKLTDKQRLFISEYPKDLNATQAAIRAGYSEHSANVQGSQNLAKPSIRKEVDKRVNKVITLNDARFERLIEHLCDITYFNPEAYTPAERINATKLLYHYNTEVMRVQDTINADKKDTLTQALEYIDQRNKEQQTNDD